MQSTRPNSKKIGIVKKVLIFILMIVVGHFVSKGIGLPDHFNTGKTNSKKAGDEDYSFFSLDHFWESKP